MTKVFLEKVKSFRNQLLNQQIEELKKTNKKKRTLSMVMIQMLFEQLQKFDNVNFQYRTLVNFANFHKDPNIKQCWTEEEWKQWHKELALLSQQLPPMEGIALAA
jgi:hypothetical protein